MKKVFSVLVAFIVATIAIANDGVYYTSGNQLVPLAETDISVKKEILTISLQDDQMAKVDVYYEFFNPGNSSKTVKMGFEAAPSYNDDYEFYRNGVHPHIHNFTVEMNSNKLPYKNAVCILEGKKKFNPIDANKYEMDPEGFNNIRLIGNSNKSIAKYAYVYYFDATFKPGLNKVHHTYSYKMSQTVGNIFEIDYKLSPAARWANKRIDDFTLIIRADKTAKHFITEKATFGSTPFAVTEGMGKIREINDGLYEVSLRNGAIKLHKQNFTPQPENELAITSADVLVNFQDNVRFGSFYDRCSSLALRILEGDYAPQFSPKISDDLKKRITKNLPYAHRGHVFKDKTLKAYFEKLWWYMPDPSYKDDTSDFTENDWYYVNHGK